MSVSGILASSLLPAGGALQNTLQRLRATEFQKLGQDLNAGNLTQAQTDFAALVQNSPNIQQNSSNPLAQELATLGQALQAGNLAGAQQDFSILQQDLQQAGQLLSHHSHLHHHMGLQDALSANEQQSNPIAQAFNSLGQALQAGNVSAAQQAYATIQQDIQLFAPTPASSSSGSGSASSAPATRGISVTA